MRDNNFTSGGRGSLHGRHSRGEGMIMHSTAAQPPSRQRAFPSQPSCCPVHRRSYFSWIPSSTRYRSLFPTRIGTRGLASEMHCTIAHRLTSHTHPTRSPAKPADSWIPPDSPLSPFSPPGRAMAKPTHRGRCHFSAAKLLLRAVRRTRAACSKT